ncbi:SDR family NAD(P)-dependent oxidoreductase [Streptomyces sp. NPDC002730]|uniref:SDR family NAD(P)-dependent oxidoreductase n=1 Tax=Streptomyces sp. NPDC002730 TaxID=3364662 RepID=UPI00368343E5
MPFHLRRGRIDESLPVPTIWRPPGRGRRASAGPANFGTLGVVRAFAPVLAVNGGGAILNVRSATSWLSYDAANAYSAAKSAEWSFTKGIRLELAGQGTTVTGLHLASPDTDMMAGWDVEKNDPADVVRTAPDGLEAGRVEILADEGSARIHQHDRLHRAVSRFQWLRLFSTA